MIKRRRLLLEYLLALLIREIITKSDITQSERRKNQKNFLEETTDFSPGKIFECYSQM